MHFLTASIFLSIIVMTQADEFCDQLKKSPLSEHTYMFVVTTDASIDDLKASFNVIGQPRHSFKVIGEPTYYFVVASESTEDLRQLTFPKGSAVTQFPVEHLNDYFKLVGADKWSETDEFLDDTVLSLDIWDFRFPGGTPVALFNTMMTAYGNQYKEAANKVKPVSYVPVAYYPPKIYYFANLEDNALQNMVENGLDVIGGVSNAVVTIKHIVKIKMTS